YFLWLDGPARKRLLRSERDYRFALANHQLMRAVTRVTVCEGGAVCLGLNLGLDNRGLLPPFMPLGRPEAGLFSTWLRPGLPSAFQGSLPWMVKPLPATPHPARAGDLGRSAAKVASVQVIQLLAGAFAPGYDRGNGAANLRALGATLARLGRVPRPEF